MQDWQPKVKFDPNSTLWKFAQDRSKVRIILGPVGSGKTVLCCINPFMIALQQKAGEGNVRPFKLAVVRNSMPELWRTTIETWLQIYKEEYCGQIRRSTPISHNIFIHDLADGTHLNFQVDFFGLDRPDQVKSLLSYEATMLYFNEMREMPKSIVDAATDRVARYPSMAKGGVMPTFAGIIGDSNPPDKDHWLYNAYENPPEGWKFFLQPPGIAEVQRIGTDAYSAKPGEPEVGTVNARQIITTASGKHYAANPKAENLYNLPVDPVFDPTIKPNETPSFAQRLGKGNYYLSRVSGKDQSWIDGYYRNRFSFIIDGEPVINEFNPELMGVEDLEVLPGVALGGGYDVGSGTLWPAGIVAQVHPLGIYLIHAEVAVDSTGLKEFGEAMNWLLEQQFPDLPLEEFFGDPAGSARDGILKQTYFDHLKSYGLPVKSAPTNDPGIRIQAIKAPMTRLRAGRPAILINKRRCPKLFKGLSGAWHYRRLQVAGTEKFASVPEKNPYSHACDALGYYLCGKGEIKNLKRRGAKQSRPERDNDHEYREFGD